MKYSDDYHDYVIKDGKFVGKFEKMYQDHESPWHQKDIKFQSDRAVSIEYLRRIEKKDVGRGHNANDGINVLELGCGLGYFTEQIRQTLCNNSKILGIDISETAIKKAKEIFTKCNFQVGDILDFNIYKEFNPNVILMPQITWYVLDKIKPLLEFLKNNYPNIIIIHNLVTYLKGVQQYGKEYFTNLDEILNFFNMDYLEYGYFHIPRTGETRTFFVGTF